MDEAPTTVTSSGGVPIALHDLGGDGPLLLAAHATGFCAGVWRPLAGHLVDTWHVVALDFRAHGDSPAPADGDLSWDRMADDVLAVVDHLGERPLLGLGHSMGGAALVLAEQARPGTFRSLYLFEPILFPARPEALAASEHPLAEGSLRRRPEFPSAQAAYDNFASKPPLSALHPDALRAYVDHGFAPRPDGSVELKCRREDEAQVFRVGVEHRGYDHLPEVACPATVAAGALPTGGPADLAPLVAERLPSAEFVAHDGLGHFGPLEDPARIAADVRRSFSR